MPRVRKNNKWEKIKLEPSDVYQCRLLHMNGAPPWTIFQRTGIPYEFMGSILAGRSFNDKQTTPIGYQPIDEASWTLK